MALSSLPSLKPAPSRAQVINVPNALTFARLLLAIILFGFLAAEWMATSLALFVVAAGTDWLDGYLARRWGETTTLGRMLDPFVDKVVVLGAFIFLLPVPEAGLAAWMVTVIVARELLVTGLRSFVEQQDVAFGADWTGKSKMLVQCLAIGAMLLYAAAVRDGRWPSDSWPLAWLATIRTGLVWVAVVLTAASGLWYCLRVVRLLRAGQRGGPAASDCGPTAARGRQADRPHRFAP